MDERLAQARIFITDYVKMLEILDKRNVLPADDPRRMAAMDALKEARNWLKVTDSASTEPK